MGTVYVFFADGFEEMEAFSAVDVMKRAYRLPPLSQAS